MKKKLFVAGLIFLVVHRVFSMPPVGDGKAIFNSRCASCHNVNKVIVGPALAGVSDRRSETWIIQFIHSSQTVIKSGDTAAASLYEKFNKVPMPDHPDLTTENIKNILAYIKSEAGKTSGIKTFRPGKTHASYTPVLSSNWPFFAGYLMLVIALACALIVLVRVKEIQRDHEQIK